MQQSSWPRNILILLVALQLIPATYKIVKGGWEALVKPKTRVGVVTIRGELKDLSIPVAQAKEFFEDQSVKGIVLIVDSPGGAPGGSQAFWHSIRELKTLHEKPIVAWVQNIAASGGYYIACAADHIVATPSALLGSIGVYLRQWRLNELINKYSVHYKTVQAGKFKTVGDPFLPPATSEQEAMLATLAHDIYQQFTHDIQLSRPHLVGGPEQWGEGKIFTGQQALKAGLIDELGSQVTVEQAIKRLANITTDIEWVRPPRTGSLARLLFGGNSGPGDDENQSYIAMMTHSLVDAFWSKLAHEQRGLDLHT